ncbi:ATP-binding protein [Stenotrophomonas maltophilia]|uniref:ATP-binding protein n=1 Tax=Stenotrophomonas maltophilia TaxID=40324 RepID=UPI00200FC650|nr:ATP-binding protein [Stenotrophomonas maltophilia]UQA71928.1 ATP-binding protein [Stenotrophomonas maltophilia]
MSRSVVIYGPQRCGKTTNAQELREHFGLREVLDDWDGHTAYPLHDTLVLTNNPHAIAHHSSRVLDHGCAMRDMCTGAQA